MPRPVRKQGAAQLEPRRRGHNAGLHWAFCGGRFVVGPDWRNVLGSGFLIAAPVGVFMGWEAKPVGESISWAAVAVIGACALASLGLLLLTAFMDPGFVPRDPPEEAAEEGNQGKTKEFQVNGYTVNTKWCSTCAHFRPPRCSHCAVCDNCVRKFDHHCPWLGNCIGERNYRFFLAFLFVTTALDCLVFAFCWARLVWLTRHGDRPDLGGAIGREPAAIVLIAYTFLAFWFVGGLGGLHVFFTSQNTTTYEHFRARYNAQGNPYSRGVRANWQEVCCTRVAPRLPERLPGRPVLAREDNGGFFDGTPDANGGGARELGQAPPQARAATIGPVAAVGPLAEETGEALQRAGTQQSLDLSSESDDAYAEGRQRVPMVSAVRRNFDLREVLDTADTDLSDTADEIKSYHSVLMVTGAQSEHAEVAYDDVPELPAAANGAAAAAAGAAIPPREPASEVPLRQHYDAGTASPAGAPEPGGGEASFPVRLAADGDVSRPSTAGTAVPVPGTATPPGAAAGKDSTPRSGAAVETAQPAPAQPVRPSEGGSTADSFADPRSHRSLFDSDAEYRSVKGGLDSDQESYSSARGLEGGGGSVGEWPEQPGRPTPARAAAAAAVPRLNLQQAGHQVQRRSEGAGATPRTASETHAQDSAAGPAAAAASSSRGEPGGNSTAAD